jgi:hypothetical protein
VEGRGGEGAWTDRFVSRKGAKVHSQNKSTMFRITESLLESSLLLLGIWVHTVNFDDRRALCQVGGDNDLQRSC